MSGSNIDCTTCAVLIRLSAAGSGVPGSWKIAVVALVADAASAPTAPPAAAASISEIPSAAPPAAPSSRRRVSDPRGRAASSASLAGRRSGSCRALIDATSRVAGAAFGSTTYTLAPAGLQPGAPNWFDQRQTSLLDPPAPGHRPAGDDGVVPHDRQLARKVDRGADVVRDDEQPVADGDVRRRRHLEHAVLLRQPHDIPLVVAHDAAEAERRVRDEHPVRRQ